MGRKRQTDRSKLGTNIPERWSVCYPGLYSEPTDQVTDEMRLGDHLSGSFRRPVRQAPAKDVWPELEPLHATRELLRDAHLVPTYLPPMVQVHARHRDLYYPPEEIRWLQQLGKASR